MPASFVVEKSTQKGGSQRWCFASGGFHPLPVRDESGAHLGRVSGRRAMGRWTPPWFGLHEAQSCGSSVNLRPEAPCPAAPVSAWPRQGRDRPLNLHIPSPGTVRRQGLMRVGGRGRPGATGILPEGPWVPDVQTRTGKDLPKVNTPRGVGDTSPAGRSHRPASLCPGGQPWALIPVKEPHFVLFSSGSPHVGQGWRGCRGRACLPSPCVPRSSEDAEGRPHP